MTDKTLLNKRNFCNCNEPEFKEDILNQIRCRICGGFP